MLNSKVKTTVRFSDEKREDKKYGITYYEQHIGVVSKKVLRETADIIIYENNIKKNARKYREPGVTSNDEKAQAIIDAKLTDEEFIESTCVHEGVHATDPQNLSSSKEDIQAREKRANEMQIKALKEIQIRKKQLQEDDKDK